ncbi:MAG TPA: type II toxin-antitoxin system RelE/ParE family toxin [Gammaproteobacteria bacterium]|nr:type II toxin-antitoxin system RelE/ParE family toxin [Gammaproteobacteria bacterium]
MNNVTAAPYDIKIAPAARQQILVLPAKSQKMIFKIVEAIAINPRPHGAKKIEGMTGLYSSSVEHIRLIYKIEEQEILVLLVK